MNGPENMSYQSWKQAFGKYKRLSPCTYQINRILDSSVGTDLKLVGLKQAGRVERQRREKLLGGSGGMLPRKVWILESLRFFWGHLCTQMKIRIIDLATLGLIFFGGGQNRPNMTDLILRRKRSLQTKEQIPWTKSGQKTWHVATNNFT